MIVKTVGLDLAKDVFQVHGISETGRKVFNKTVVKATVKLSNVFSSEILARPVNRNIRQ